jgi:hypothetical protein
VSTVYGAKDANPVKQWFYSSFDIVPVSWYQIAIFPQFSFPSGFPPKTCGNDDDILFTFYVNPQILLKTHLFLLKFR